ncbi:MAG TPA: hypothetical protein DHV16_06190 [Nitrospiraceae bacterium]|nr:MAG: hypothetical protein A2Z82_08345 [Nitrospirae bacterium GWA2_46_11]OGW23348.1 MAG: hypothetical protein A2X55_10845 [Nitrospirae bacterium GWB2_47_37]HAK87794.1 hypothetical protein [Nitrospiraceae bacterium]HCZ11833.1 hypothetical protein [Nitrospiraceae bacterium]
MAMYELIIRFNKSTGKTSFGYLKDGKDNINPDTDELRTYFSVLKLVMDKVGLRLKTELENKG